MSSNKANGNQTQMMMMMALSCAACMCLVSVAGGALYFFRNPPKDSGGDLGGDIDLSGNQTTAPTSSSSSSSGGGSSLTGTYMIKNGGLSLVVDPKNAKNKTVWFEDSQESNQHEWNITPVRNKPDYVYIQSDHRLFKKGSNNSYLTGPQNCSTGGPTVERPIYADRQYWKLVQTGDKYQLVNAACENRRSPSYMISSGARSGNGRGKGRSARFSARSGSPYSIVSP